MYLPQELKGEVLGYLDKDDLKAVRLVDKSWSSCTLPFLVDRIHWSSQDLDRDIFGYIVGDTALASHIKILEINRSYFDPNLSKPKYFEGLCSQIEVMVALERMKHGNGEGLVSDTFQGIDPEIFELALKVKWPRTPELTDGLWKDFGNSSFVNEGYGKYMACAGKQQELLHDTRVFEEFCAGLTCLKNLQEVHLPPRWASSPMHIRGNDELKSPGSPRSDGKVYPSPGAPRSDDEVRRTTITASNGSPLARSWNIFYTWPSIWTPQSIERGSVNGDLLGFFRMSTALLVTAKQPRVLTIGETSYLFSEDSETGPEGCAPLFYWDERCPEVDAILCGIFRELTHLTLHFASYPSIMMPLNYPLRALGRFLGSLKSLRFLDLILPDCKKDLQQLYRYDELYSHNEVFSTTAGTWPHLQTLYVRNMIIGTKDILRLLGRTPSLRILVVSNICLYDGRWEWIMEYLHRHMQLDEFNILSDWQYGGLCYGLLYPNGTAYGHTLDQYIPKLEQYVTRRGPRPKLHTDEQDGMAQRYLDKLKKFL